MARTASGILIPDSVAAPEKVGVPCGYCPKVIFKDEEAKGRLYLLNGRPACARCRVMRGKMGGLIRSHKPLYDRDVAQKEERIQEHANEMARIVAADTQKATKTKKK